MHDVLLVLRILLSVHRHAHVLAERAHVLTPNLEEITELDVDKSIMASKGEIPQSFIVNREIIHTIPIHYKVDGKSALGRPNGMKGLRLEAKTHFITCLEHHLRDLVEVIGEAGVETEDIVAAPIAASIVTLTKAQKVAGKTIEEVRKAVGIR